MLLFCDFLRFISIRLCATKALLTMGELSDCMLWAACGTEFFGFLNPLNLTLSPPDERIIFCLGEGSLVAPLLASQAQKLWK